MTGNNTFGHENWYWTCPFPINNYKNGGKISEATVFRHWTRGTRRQRFLREGKHIWVPNTPWLSDSRHTRDHTSRKWHLSQDGNLTELKELRLNLRQLKQLEFEEQSSEENEVATVRGLPEVDVRANQGLWLMAGMCMYKARLCKAYKALPAM